MTISFDTSYAELLRWLDPQLSLPNGAQSTFLCLTQCCIVRTADDPALFIQQTHQLITAIWARPEYANAHFLRQVLVDPSDLDEPLLRALLDHPDMIRSCLLLARFTDDNLKYTRVVNVPRSNTEFTTVDFLRNLPGIDTSLPDQGPWLDAVGTALLGTQWPFLESIYAFHACTVKELAQALLEVPAPNLRLPSSDKALPEPPALPDTLCS